ncbi:hypothetical protein B0T22DRAFT_461784 [Podospora appendiculata]|uniref:Uncharacterized protein n=1 Tax=Podospora appendiculata TaxID=314037 RepID=A0AAE0XBJ2_9PEZI|nr:hypothetical protein B0T22DRAFT_461784 [Podospora appendiculata]
MKERLNRPLSGLPGLRSRAAKKNTDPVTKLRRTSSRTSGVTVSSEKEPRGMDESDDGGPGDPPGQIDDLEAQANEILGLLSKLLETADQDVSRNWNLEHELLDLLEGIGRLKKQLRESVTLSDWENPPWKSRTALEATYERRINELKDKVKSLEAEVRALRERLETMQGRLDREISKNWALGYDCRDLAGKIWRLEAQLRNSITLGDLEKPPRKPKTALERALERRVRELEGRVARPHGKPRSRTM